LGPLLFIIYVNDLPDVCNNLHNLHFSWVCKIWNSLPDSVVDADTLNTFKNRQKCLLTVSFSFNESLLCLDISNKLSEK